MNRVRFGVVVIGLAGMVSFAAGQAANGGGAAGGAQGGAVGGAAVVRPGVVVGGQMYGGNWRSAQMIGQMQLDTYVRALAEANLAPDFSLEKAQKEKIAAIRESFKTDMEKFGTDNQEEFTKLQDAMRAAAGNQAQVADLMKQQQELLAKAPKAQDYIDKIKATLAAEQIKVVEEKAQQPGRTGFPPGIVKPMPAPLPMPRVITPD